MPEEVIEVSPSEAGLETVRHLIESGRVASALDHLSKLHPADQATILAELDEDRRPQLLGRLPPAALGEIFEYLEDEPRREIALELEPAVLGSVLDHVDRDVATDVLHELPQERSRPTLAAMSTASELAPLLTYSDESAGGRMTSDFVALHRAWTVLQALEYLRRTRPAADQVYYLYVVDDAHRLEGVVSLRQLVVGEPDERIGDLMAPEVFSVNVNADQEEVARQAQHYNFVAFPVVDDAGVLVGVIGIDDLIDVVEEEATEDMYRMAGVGVKERAFSPLRESVTRRVPWLTFNMGWAFAGAAVIALFEGTLERAAAVAIFMPMIAGQAGNAGIQTATIVVRSMALGEVETSDASRLLAKELAMGAIKGIIFGCALGLVAWLWQENAALGVAAGLALFLNMLVASTAGVLVPMTMRRLGLDPATIAGVFDTMLTDLMGFIIYLSLVTLLIDQIA